MDEARKRIGREEGERNDAETTSIQKEKMINRQEIMSVEDAELSFSHKVIMEIGPNGKE